MLDAMDFLLYVMAIGAVTSAFFLLGAVLIFTLPDTSGRALLD